MTDAMVEVLRLKIEEATGLPIGLEGRYRWIRFCESKQKSGRAVPNRYFGAFTNETTKVRGIELRRHDAPLIVKALQQEMLDLMATAQTGAELAGLESRLEEIKDRYAERVRLGLVTPMDLAISKQLRHAPSDYLHDTLTSLAAQKMEAAGVALHPGETISYLVTAEKDAVKDWRAMPLALIEDTFEYDVRYYQRLLEGAAGVLFSFSNKTPNRISKHGLAQQGRVSLRRRRNSRHFILESQLHFDF
jgi:DNA polymerase-2